MYSCSGCFISRDEAGCSDPKAAAVVPEGLRLRELDVAWILGLRAAGAAYFLHRFLHSSVCRSEVTRLECWVTSNVIQTAFQVLCLGTKVRQEHSSGGVLGASGPITAVGTHDSCFALGGHHVTSLRPEGNRHDL